MSATENITLFEAERPRLLRLAYRHLGLVSDAEDVVQEAWLRFSGAQDVREPAAFLSTVVTRLCLDRMKSAAYRREQYVGEWLPEPYIEPDDGYQDAALDISFAVMRSLETLTPEERAAFFLHDIFETPYDEIAQTLKRTPAGCRKLVERARKSLAGGKKRFAPKEADVHRFVAALEKAISNDDTALRQLLSEEAELITDSGGKVLAARNIIHGRDFVAKFLLGISRKAVAEKLVVEPHTVRMNGAPGLVVSLNGKIDLALSFDLDQDGNIRTIYAMRNPDKLRNIGAEPRTAD